MGFASYFEDILSKFYDEYSFLLREIDIEKLSAPPNQAKIKSIINTCNSLLAQILDIATDPDNSHLMNEFILKMDNRDLKEEITLEKDKATNYILKISTLRYEHKKQLKERDLEIEMLKKEISFLKHPGKSYEKSFKDLKKHKPN